MGHPPIFLMKADALLVMNNISHFEKQLIESE